MSAVAVPRLSLPGQIASQAEFLVNNFRQTDYQHHDNIDVDRGVYDCDCNGFAAFVLERAAPGHYHLVPTEQGHARPRAYLYYEFFAGLTETPVAGWRRIEDFRQVSRGDLVAWRFKEIQVGHDTGHVLIAAETPNQLKEDVFSLRVYDSAAEPHFEDTRAAEQTGIGSGFINFQVGPEGNPISFQFAPPSSSKFVVVPISIGRIEDFPAVK